MRINSVRWLNGVDYETELISGSADHTAIVWSLKENEYVPYSLIGHEANVNIVDGLYKGPGKERAVVVTVAMDSTVRIWYRKNQRENFLQSQVLNLGYSISVGVRIAIFPDSESVILATALDNSQIQLYVENTGSTELKLSTSICLKGHEDWVRGLDFKIDDDGDLILASSSQDLYIRLWRITQKNLNKTTQNMTLETLNQSITIKNKNYRIYVDSILSGHEGWIYSVNWAPNTLQLLSASLDKSMIIWEFDPENNLWLDKIRVGEVGGNTLGFYGGCFSPDGKSIFAHSYHGAFHIWTLKNGYWEPGVVIRGHFGDVVDLGWEPQGEFLVSVSADQTSRIHAPWRNANDVVSIVFLYSIAM